MVVEGVLAGGIDVGATSESVADVSRDEEDGAISGSTGSGESPPIA
jgi:hypothetical protein